MQALTIEHLSKRYADGFEALKGINLNVEQGDFYALLGPNGAGKSTTIGIISGLINKTSGRVSVFGDDMDQFPERVKSHIGLVPQEFNFNVFEAIRDVLVNQAGYHGIARKQALGRAEKYLRQLDLWEKRKSAGRELSGGMKRRLMIARALVHEPKLLILDEPTAGVDIEIRRSMWEYLKHINEQEGVTIILTTHYLEEAESLCRNVGIIDRGEIVMQGRVRDLLSQASVETFVLDADVSDSFRCPEAFGKFRVIDCSPGRLEVEVPKGKSLNELFVLLSQEQITINSMRNKSNRLEEFFIRLVQRQSA